MLSDRGYMRDVQSGTKWTATVILIIVNVAFYALELIGALTGRSPLSIALSYLPLYPTDLAHGWIWQLLTFQLLHAGPLHLILNCAMLYIFGRPLERTMGQSLFLRLYFGCGAFGGLLQAACAWVFPSHFGTGPVVGASAGVFGLIAAFALLNREMPITTLVAFIIPVTMKAKYLLVVETILAVLGMLDRRSGVAHAAHLGGMIAALLFLIGYRALANRTLRWPRFRTPPRERELVTTPSAGKSGMRQRRVRAGSEPQSTADFMSREVDPILEKISAHGIQSLTERERKILELARSRINGP